jgi:hypothetical protein
VVKPRVVVENQIDHHLGALTTLVRHLAHLGSIIGTASDLVNSRDGPGWEGVREGVDGEAGWPSYLPRYAALLGGEGRSRTEGRARRPQILVGSNACSGLVRRGRRWGLEYDHVNPVANSGPTEYTNLEARCWPDHQAKTERDRAAGLLGPHPPDKS